MDLQEPMEEDEFQDQDILDQLGLASPQAQDFTTAASLSKGAEILIMSVDLGDGRTGQITVHENDDPEYLAREFCVEFRLSEDLVRPLTEQIEENVAELRVEVAAPQSQPWEEQLSRLIQKPAEAKPTINERSRDMHKDMRGVFERLQSKPLPAKPVPISEIPTAQASKRYMGFSNPGEKLYFKGVKMKEDVRKHCQELLKAKGSEESKELTFTPKLNDNSVLLTKRSRSVLKHRSPEDLLLVRGRISQENREKTRGEQLAQEHSQCTFAPAINPVSERIVNSVKRSSSVQRFQELHEDANKRKERQGLIADSFLAANCPFQPRLIAKQYVVEQPLYGMSEDKKDVQKYSELERVRLDPNTDLSTGQPLYHPRTGRSPKKPRHPHYEPVGDYLYRLRSHSKPRPQPAPPADLTSASKDTSERLLRKKRKDRYEELFELLNPDENQEICAGRVVVENIDREVLMLIAPLLEELEALKVTLNFEEYCEAMDALVKTLTPPQKAKLLNYAKKDVNGADSGSYRPTINSYRGSARFQQRSRTPFYERIMEQRQRLAQKIEAQKQLQRDREVQECSFQPKTIPYAARSSQVLGESQLEIFPNSWSVL